MLFYSGLSFWHHLKKDNKFQQNIPAVIKNYCNFILVNSVMVRSKGAAKAFEEGKFNFDSKNKVQSEERGSLFAFLQTVILSPCFTPVSGESCVGGGDAAADFGIVFDEGDVGFEAVTACEFDDFAEEEGGYGFAGNLPGIGFLQGLGNG